MKAGEVYWVAEEIHGWRREVGVEKKCDGEKLRSIFARISEPETRGLTILTILASEWLFRVKRIGKSEIDFVLGELERGFRRILPHDLSHLVAEALAPSIEAALRKEGRVHFPLSPFCRDAPELLYYPLWEPERRKYHPHHRVKPQPGPLVWIAPWIAALAVERHLTERGLKPRSLCLGLVNALLGRYPSVDSNEYGKQRRRLDGPHLQQYCEQLKKRFAFMLSITADPTADPDLILAGMLKSLCPAGLFPLDPESPRRLLASYKSTRRHTHPRRR